MSGGDTGRAISDPTADNPESGRLALPVCEVVPSLKRTPAALTGVLPDLRDWKSGDIILLAGDEKLGGVIERIQRRQWGDSARWTHAALYAGGGYVVESVFSADPRRWGVFRSSMAAYASRREILRLHDPALTDEERGALVRAAQAIDATYDVIGAVRTGIAAYLTPPATPKKPRTRRTMLGRRMRLREVAAIRARVCSDVIEAAYDLALDRTAAPTARDFVPPAAFADCPQFMRFAVTHCRIAAAT